MRGLPFDPMLSCSFSAWFSPQRIRISLASWPRSSPRMKMFVAAQHTHKKKSSKSTNNTATACSSNQEQNPISRLPESISISASFFSSCSLRRSFVRMLSSKRRRKARISCRCSPSRSDGQAYTKYWIKKTPVSIQFTCNYSSCVTDTV